MSLPINIAQLIAGTTVESERKEFKAGYDKLEALHAIAAFANDFHNWGGGYMIFGIAAIDGVPQLPPIGLNPAILDDIQKDLVNATYKIDPYYCPEIEIYPFQGKHILILWIPGGDNRPYKAPISLTSDSQKAYYIRKGTVTQKVNPTEERQLLEMARRIPFDDRVNHAATIDDLDISLIGTYLAEISSELMTDYLQMPKEDLVRKMQIARGSNEYLKPINVGLLMFNKDPEKFFRGASITLVQYVDGSGTNYTEKQFKGPIYQQIKAVLEFFENNIVKTQVRKSSETARAIRVQNYPREAFEEALVNAVYHKSYEHESCVEINVRPEGIEILSFPGPLPPINKSRLKEMKIVARDYRNRRIGDFLKELHLTEGRGTGIPTIKDSMARNHSPLPVLETDDDNTFFLAKLPIQREFLEIALSDYQLEILRFCKLPRTRKELLEHIGLVSHYENFERHALPLIEAGYIDLTFPTIPRTPKQRYVTSLKGSKRL